MRDPVHEADVPAERSPVRYLVPAPSTFRNYTSCPWATSIRMIDPETNKPILAQVTCKRWGCAYCAPRKIKKLSYLTNQAEPNRWIRLGVNPALHESPEAAWRKTSPQVPELFRVLRQDGKEYEYLRVAELHNASTKYSELPVEYKALGFPHYHCLLRSPYIPQRKLSDLWDKLTAAPVVYIAKIDQSFRTFRYLVKYLTKLHRIEWTDRHVSYSKGFFTDESKEKLEYPEKQVIERSELHPWVYLTNYYYGQEIGLDAAGYYLLPADKSYPPDTKTPQDLGLRIPTQTETTPAINQASLPGLEDAQTCGYGDEPF